MMGFLPFVKPAFPPERTARMVVSVELDWPREGVSLDGKAKPLAGSDGVEPSLLELVEETVVSSLAALGCLRGNGRRPSLLNLFEGFCQACEVLLQSEFRRKISWKPSPALLGEAPARPGDLLRRANSPQAEIGWQGTAQIERQRVVRIGSPNAIASIKLTGLSFPQ
jgi:hypothetical protein